MKGRISWQEIWIPPNARELKTVHPKMVIYSFGELSFVGGGEELFSVQVCVCVCVFKPVGGNVSTLLLTSLPVLAPPPFPVRKPLC